MGHSPTVEASNGKLYHIFIFCGHKNRPGKPSATHKTRHAIFSSSWLFSRYVNWKLWRQCHRMPEEEKKSFWEFAQYFVCLCFDCENIIKVWTLCNVIQENNFQMYVTRASKRMFECEKLMLTTDWVSHKLLQSNHTCNFHSDSDQVLVYLPVFMSLSICQYAVYSSM